MTLCLNKSPNVSTYRKAYWVVWQVIDRIMRAEYVIPGRPHISESCKDLLQKLLTVDPLQRLDAGGCQKHPWFQEASSHRAQQPHSTARIYLHTLTYFPAPSALVTSVSVVQTEASPPMQGLPPNALGMNADCLATSTRRQTQQSEDQIRQLVHQARSVEQARPGPAHSVMDIDVGFASDAQVSARAA